MKCGSTDSLSYDHIIPVSWIGIAESTYLNLQILCRFCNTGKRDRFSFDFRDMSVPIINSEERSYTGVNVLELLEKEKLYN